jgi:hypothetical protein
MIVDVVMVIKLTDLLINLMPLDRLVPNKYAGTVDYR